MPQGDFERLDPTDNPVGWTWTQYGNVTTRQEPSGNHYLYIGQELKGRTLQAFARIVLDRAWKRIVVSARLRVRNLVVSLNGLTAGVITRIMDKNDKLIAYAPQLGLKQDCDWTPFSAAFDLPAGADHLNIEVSNIGADGDFSADDLSFVPETKSAW